ncbi:MAG: S8 family serine peptidase [Rikenellaceae bacterium]|nr:S8 family serine peptidase [Rikenellaceae bacterium]
MRIAIIDSGADCSHERLANAKITGISFYSKNQEIHKSENFHDDTGHGTSIAAIIHKHLPEAELHCVKVFSKVMFINENALYHALEYCIDSGYKLINLSLGIHLPSPPEKLVKICQKAYEKNIILVSAANNSTVGPSYPAALPYSFGVSSGSGIKKSSEYGYQSDSSIEFLAKGSIQRIAVHNREYKIAQGTSYACAHFTGIVAKKMSEGNFKSFPENKEELIKNSLPNIKPFIHYQEKMSMDYTVSNQEIDQIGDKTFVNKKKFDWLKKLLYFLYQIKNYPSSISTIN